MWFMPQAAIENIPEMAVCGFSFSKTVGEKNKRKKNLFSSCINQDQTARTDREDLVVF